jgi:hypothetical protein
MNSVPGVITFESKVCDSSLGGSFLPSLSNSSRNLDSSAAYHTREKQSKKGESNLHFFLNISTVSQRYQS